MEIRPARPEDAAAISGLAWRAKAHWGYPAAWMEVWREELTLTAEYLEMHPAWCAEAQGDLAGFCALELGGDAMEIGHLWVAPERQGTGIGRALLMEALKTAGRMRPAVSVRVVSDPNAVSFYVRMGARRIGSVPAPMTGEPSRELPVLVLAAAAPSG